MCVELSRELGPILLKSIHVYIKPPIISILFSETKTPHFRRWPRADMYIIIVVWNSINTKRSLKIDVVYRKKKPNNSQSGEKNVTRRVGSLRCFWCIVYLLYYCKYAHAALIPCVCLYIIEEERFSREKMYALQYNALFIEFS